MRRVLAGLVVLFAAASANAADKPTVEVRVKSINDLLPAAEYLGGLVGQEEAAKQGVAVVKAFAGAKGLEGIDVKRPIGLSATLTPDMIDSPIVLLVPIADEPAFLNLLTGRLSLTPTKGDDGVYELAVPNFNPKVYFTFAGGYLHAAVHNRKALDADARVDAKAFFEKAPDSAVAVDLHVDRIPEAVRKSFLGQLELRLADLRKQHADEPGYDLGSQMAFRAVRTGLDDGRTLGVRLDVDPKADEVRLTAGLTARPDSYLAGALASAGKRPSAGYLASVGANPIAAASAGFALPDWATKLLTAAVDRIVTDALDKAPNDAREHVQKVIDAVRPTLTSGVLDVGLAVGGKLGGLKVAAAVGTVEGSKVEAVAKEYAPFLNQNGPLSLTTDVARAGKGNLHKLVVSEPGFADAFGTDTLWLATADERLVVTAGADDAAAKKLAAAPPAAGPLFAAEVSVARLVLLTEKAVSQDKLKALADEAFGDKGPVGRDVVSLSVTAGPTAGVKLVVKGKAVRYAMMVDQAKKGQ